MGTFGNDSSSLATAGGISNGVCRVARYTLAESVSITKMSAFLVALGEVNTHNFVCFIKADDGGGPAAANLGVTQAGDVTTHGGGTEAWWDATFSTPVELSAGNYWLGVMSGHDDLYFYYGTAGDYHIRSGTYTYPTPGACDGWFGSGSQQVRITATWEDPVPTITEVSPASGTYAGGTSVTLTGTNFTNATDVDFGTTAASSFTVNSATSISATTPAHAVGTVDVTVTTAAGTSATTGTGNDFEFIVPAPTISAAQSGSDIVVTWS